MGRECESWEGSGGLAVGVGRGARAERVAVGVGRECESWERSGGLAAGVGRERVSLEGGK